MLNDQSFGIQRAAIDEIAAALKRMQQRGHQLALVIGGGNIFRGTQRDTIGLERVPADHVGMLATMMNGIALLGALKRIDCDAQVMSALECPQVAELYSWQHAHIHLDAGRILILVGGTGNPYFSTDTAAALRASEINADLLLKATKVNGIYDKDPAIHHDAKRYNRISYEEALAQRLEVMDAAAFALCMNHRIPLFVFNMAKLATQTIEEIVTDHNHGTLVKEDH